MVELWAAGLGQADLEVTPESNASARETAGFVIPSG
jgi:hypothetical protein